MAERESRLERARREWKPGQTAPPRSVRILFASSVLSLEALLMFFYGLMAGGCIRTSGSPGGSSAAHWWWRRCWSSPAPS